MMTSLRITAWMLGFYFLLLAKSLNAADVDFSYESFYIDQSLGRAKIIIKVQNNTGMLIKSLFAECAFLNEKNTAIDTAVLIGHNIEPSGYAYLDAWSSAVDGIRHADCRISRFR